MIMEKNHNLGSISEFQRTAVKFYHIAVSLKAKSNRKFHRYRGGILDVSFKGNKLIKNNYKGQLM